MNARRQTHCVGQYAILAGTGCAAIWLMVSVSLGYSVATTASAALSALLFAQWFVALVSAPVFSRASFGKVAGSALGIVLIPWPLLALCIQMTSVSVGSVLTAQLLLLGTLIVCFGAATWLKNILPPVWQTSGVSMLQTVFAIGLMLSWPHWSGWVSA